MSGKRLLKGTTSRAPLKASNGAARARRAQAREGRVLCGKWRLDRLIGLGGVAAVYAATDEHGRRAAIKILHSDLAELPEVRERFVEEAYVANRVGHPGAVAVRDESTSEDGTIFLVMDLLEGATLDQLYNSGAGFTPSQVLEVAEQVLGVLAAAHDKGIIHRDIKPDNVFVTLDGMVRVLDFGVARVADTRRAHTTETGATVGTPAFMPPEQARGHWDKLDGRADIWSLGATMYFMLTGRLVREADTPNEELLSAMTEPVPSIRELVAVPRVLAEVVDRALAFDVRDRYANAREMRDAVRRALTALQDPTREPDRGAPSRSGRTLMRSRVTFALGPRRAPAPPLGNGVLAAAGLVLALGLVLSAFGLAALLHRSDSSSDSEAPQDARSSALGSELSKGAVIAVETADLVELPPEVDQLVLTSAGVPDPAEPDESKLDAQQAR